MNRKEQLLVILMEECGEITEILNRVNKRTSKALRFGLDEIQDGETETNAERIVSELNDLYGVVELLTEEGYLPQLSRDEIEAKKKRIEKYFEISKEHGTLDDEEEIEEYNPEKYPLYNADPDCKHEIEIRWSGYGCKHCTGWFCL